MSAPAAGTLTMSSELSMSVEKPFSGPGVSVRSTWRRPDTNTLDTWVPATTDSDSDCKPISQHALMAAASHALRSLSTNV
eukprot:126248-Chlamydomonas_euryale.AAC.3